MICALLYLANLNGVYDRIYNFIEQREFKGYNWRDDIFGMDERKKRENVEVETVLVLGLGFFLTGFIDALIYGLIMVVLK